MVEITDEMSKFMDNERLGFVATVSPDGRPNVSPKGSVIRRNAGQIAFAEIRSPDTITNLASNPHVEVSVISPIIRRGYLFSGKGATIKEGPEFDEMVGRFKDIGIQSPISAVVIIDVDRVEETRSPLYDLGYAEDQIKAKWKSHYFPA